MTTENKTIVQRALAALLETGDADALAPFLSDDFVHHRPDGHSRSRKEWLADVGAAQVPLAGQQVEVLRMLADDDHVMVHSRRRLPGADPEVVVVDICRIDDGLIAEMWEVIEPVAHAAANLRWWETARPAALEAS
jgi:predicted SnoaL-like aldol condensation-catalyzing enzyme